MFHIKFLVTVSKDLDFLNASWWSRILEKFIPRIFLCKPQYLASIFPDDVQYMKFFELLSPIFSDRDKIIFSLAASESQ